MPAPMPPPLLRSRLEWWIAALYMDRRLSFGYGEQQEYQLRQQTKQMACSELLNVYVWMVGGVGAGEVLLKFAPCSVLTRNASPHHPL